ncbi:LAFA_0G17568g1_1 [Lachancea sp. 'fantastica']|nr:LAFA_0G17568g1_1 [Lachancea sp. 'fantastica']
MLVSNDPMFLAPILCRYYCILNSQYHNPIVRATITMITVIKTLFPAFKLYLFSFKEITKTQILFLFQNYFNQQLKASTPKSCAILRLEPYITRPFIALLFTSNISYHFILSCLHRYIIRITPYVSVPVFSFFSSFLFFSSLLSQNYHAIIS